MIILYYCIMDTESHKLLIYLFYNKQQNIPRTQRKREKRDYKKII